MNGHRVITTGGWSRMRQHSWKTAQLSGILLGVLAAMPRGAAAAEKGAVAPAASGAAANTAAPADSRKRMMEDMQAKLDGSRWEIEWKPIAGKGKPQKDALTFTKRTIASERLIKAGYPETNYTLTVKENEPAVWETMQTKEGEGVVFWRGEFHGAGMRGVVSKHPLEGGTEDFSFVGREVSGKAVGEHGEEPQATSSSGTPSSIQEPEALPSLEGKGDKPQKATKEKRKKRS